MIRNETSIRTRFFWYEQHAHLLPCRRSAILVVLLTPTARVHVPGSATRDKIKTGHVKQKRVLNARKNGGRAIRAFSEQRVVQHVPGLDGHRSSHVGDLRRRALPCVASVAGSSRRRSAANGRPPCATAGVARGAPKHHNATRAKQHKRAHKQVRTCGPRGCPTCSW